MNVNLSPRGWRRALSTLKIKHDEARKLHDVEEGFSPELKAKTDRYSKSIKKIKRSLAQRTLSFHKKYSHEL
jgi:hypothetical protein